MCFLIEHDHVRPTTLWNSVAIASHQLRNRFVRIRDILADMQTFSGPTVAGTDLHLSNVVVSAVRRQVGVQLCY